LTYAFTVDFHDLQILEKVRVLCLDFKGTSEQITFQIKSYNCVGLGSHLL
jgi:hypothetical protein